MDRSRVGLVIPALNEARSVGAVVARSLEYGVPIVVDDGSTDGTGDVAEKAGAQVVRHAVNRGYDGALSSGFERAAELGLDYVVTLDADGQHDPRTLVAFLTALDQGAEVVVGVRDRMQRVSERAFAWVGRRLWGIDDPLCGMKGYRTSVYRTHGCFDSCRSIGTELAICSAARGLRVRQVPVPTRDRVGTPRFGNRIRANARIFRALVLMIGKARRVRGSFTAERVAR